MSEFGDNCYSYVEHQRLLRETFGMDAATKAAYFDGLMAGMMGFPADHLSGVALIGYQAGIAGKKKSEELRRRKSEAGKRSAEARAENNGSADPRANREQNREQCSQPVHANREQNVNVGRKEGRKEANASSSTSNPSVNTARDRISPPGPCSALPDRTKQPVKAEFLAFAGRQWPEWHRRKVSEIYELWDRAGWRTPPSERDPQGSPITDWLALLKVFRGLADPAHIGERHPIGLKLLHADPATANAMRFEP